MNWRIGWVSIDWDGRPVAGGVDPVCDACGEAVCNGIALGHAQGMLWEHAASGARTLRCNRPSCLVPAPPTRFSGLALLGLSRLAELVEWASIAAGDARNEAAASLLHRAELMSRASRMVLEVDTGAGKRRDGDVHRLLWESPWSAEADRLAVLELLTAYEAIPSPGLTLADYLYLRHRDDVGTLIYWVARVTTIEAALGLEGHEGAQAALPFDPSDPSDLPGGA